MNPDALLAWEGKDEGRCQVPVTWPTYSDALEDRLRESSNPSQVIREIIADELREVRRRARGEGLGLALAFVTDSQQPKITVAALALLTGLNIPMGVNAAALATRAGCTQDVLLLEVQRCKAIIENVTCCAGKP